MASAWLDKKVVMVMSISCSDPSLQMKVGRRLSDGTKIDVPCPSSISEYNTYMRGVDRGDQIRGTIKQELNAGSSTNISFGFYLIL